jgi:hypothetical protein
VAPSPGPQRLGTGKSLQSAFSGVSGSLPFGESVGEHELDRYVVGVGAGMVNGNALFEALVFFQDRLPTALSGER